LISGNLKLADTGDSIIRLQN